MNILVTSISRKVPLLNEVRKAANKISENIVLFGADVDSKVVGKYFVDYFWHIPPLTDLTIENLITYCKSNKINAIIPTRDGELLFFAENKEKLAEHGIHSMISESASVARCLNKLNFFSYGSKLGYPVINTTNEIKALNCERFVVKEQYGSGSYNIGLDLSRQEALIKSEKLNQPIFQPYITGEEYSIDVFIDKNGIVRGSVARKREVVLNGESQITTTTHFPELEQMCSELVLDFGLYGHIVFQVIVDSDGYFNLIECNPRFGGASTLSIGVGLDSFYWFLLEATGENIDNAPFNRSYTDKRLIRYPTDRIIEV